MYNTIADTLREIDAEIAQLRAGIKRDDHAAADALFFFSNADRWQAHKNAAREKREKLREAEARRAQLQSIIA